MKAFIVDRKSKDGLRRRAKCQTWNCWRMRQGTVRSVFSKSSTHNPTHNTPSLLRLSMT